MDLFFSFLSLGHFISSFIFLFLHLSAVILFLTEANKAIRKLMLCLNKITVSPKVPDWCLLTSQLSDPQIRAVRRESCWWKSLALFLSHTLSHTRTHTHTHHIGNRDDLTCLCRKFESKLKSKMLILLLNCRADAGLDNRTDAKKHFFPATSTCQLLRKEFGLMLYVIWIK